MKKLYRLLFIPTLFLFNSCNTLISTSVTKSYDPLEYAEEVFVFEEDQPIPDSAEIIGHVNINDSGFTLTSNCTYNVVINEAKFEAKKIGGNAIKITEHILPSNMGSSCHRIEADILKINNIASFAPKEESDSKEYNSLSPNNSQTAGEVKENPKFRAAINGGYSYRSAMLSENIPSDFENYYKKLKSGYHFGCDATYYFSGSFGVGLKGYLLKSSNEMDNVYITDLEGNTRYGSMSDDITISYLGPIFSTRLLNQDNTRTILVDLSLGYMGYKDNMVFVDSYTLTGQTLGFSFSVGYDMEIAKNFILGFQLSYLNGTLFEYDSNDGVTTKTIKLEDDEYESLNRLDFSVGLRFSK